MSVRGESFDVVIAGSGPAGAVAATVLARGGARVLLVDPGRFPRDKACGDIVGPRGVKVLDELAVLPADDGPAADVILVGPTWRAVRLPWPAGETYPTGARVFRRARFDAALNAAALAAGAEARTTRVADVTPGPAGTRVRMTDGSHAHAAFAIGADGALSRVGASARLLRPARALWGFALRAYAAGEVHAPHILLWAPDGRRPVPGYGWVFPAGPGQVNVGLGIAMRDRRARAALAGQLLPAFTRALRERGLLADGATQPRRGGWLRMGMSGCVPAQGRVLLAGDAAGLVNPLQGEGLAEAIASGRAAADAILQRPGDAASAYRVALAQTLGTFQATAGALQDVLVARPRLRALAARAATAPRAGAAAAPGVAIWCNDLLDGARHGPARRSAAAIAAAAMLATTASARRAHVLAALDPAGAAAAPQPAPTGVGYGLQAPASAGSLA